MLAAVDILKLMLTRKAVADISATSTYITALVGALEPLKNISEEAAKTTLQVVEMMIESGAIADISGVPDEISKLSVAFGGMGQSAAPAKAAKPSTPVQQAAAKPARQAPAPAPQARAAAPATTEKAPAPKTAAPKTAVPVPGPVPPAAAKQTAPMGKSAPKAATPKTAAASKATGAKQVPEQAHASAHGPEGQNGPAPVVNRQQPAVPIRDCFNADYLICLEDGKKMKMLKRHLRAEYNLTPEEYRRKWGLPEDFPMVAPNYAKQKSRYARSIGLGSSKMRQEVAQKRQEVDA